MLPYISGQNMYWHSLQASHEERFITQRVGATEIFCIIVRYGYVDHVSTNNFSAILHDQLKAFLPSKIALAASQLVSVLIACSPPSTRHI